MTAHFTTRLEAEEYTWMLRDADSPKDWESPPSYAIAEDDGTFVIWAYHLRRAITWEDIEEAKKNG